MQLKINLNIKHFSLIAVLVFTIIACHKKINKSLEKETELNTFLKKNKKSPLDSFKIKLTEDNVPDYLIFDESDYNSPILFFDGNTEKEIKYNYSTTSNFSNFDTIKFDCKKNKNALAFKTGSIDDYYEFSIFSYDDKSDSLQQVFRYPIVDVKNKKIRFVKFSNCNDTLMTYEGKIVKGRILPLNKKIIDIYIYNVDENKFDKRN